MFKNVASQKLIVYAFDSTTNQPKTGDAANLTAYVSKDYGSVTVLGDTSATEMDSTNAKGYYLFDLTQAETNADTLLFTCKSATSNIVVLGMPATVYTTPASFTSFTTPPTVAQIATGVWQDTTSGDFTVSASIGKSIMNGVALGTGLTVNDITTKTGFSLANGSFVTATFGTCDFTSTMKTSIGTAVAASAVASVTGNVGGNVIGSVGSIASGGITEASFATTAGSFAPLGIVDQGTAQSATGTTVVLRSASAFADDTLIGCTIAVFGSTQGYWQERIITDNTLIDDTVVVDTWPVTPSGTITYKIFMTPTAPASASSTIAAAVWDLATSGHTNSGTFGEAAVAAGGAGDPWTTTLPGSYTGSQAGKMLSDILTDTNELQTDWTNGGRLDLIIDATLADTNELQTDWVNGGRLDLIIDATLADTNELQTDWANGGRLDLLVDSIINNQVAASGTVNDVSATTTAFNTNLSAANNAYNDMLLKWKTGANAGLAPIPVLTYANTNGRITLTEALTAAPSNGDTFDLMVSHIHPVTQIATAVWTDTTSSDFTTAGSIGKSLFTSGVVPGASGGLFIAGSNAATTVNITGNITGNLSGSVGSVTGAVGSVTGLTASDVAAIKAKTDQLVFTISNTLNVNVRYVNSVQIDGAGTTGDPWGPA